MILFNKIYAPVVPVPFTRATKETIWNLLKEQKSPRQMFIENNVPIEDTELVIEEIKRLEAETFSKIRGTWQLTPAVLNEDGSVQTPATYYQPTTVVSLAQTMSSPYVIIGDFLTDLIKYYPTYNEARNWNQFKIAVQNG